MNQTPQISAFAIHSAKKKKITKLRKRELSKKMNKSFEMKKELEKIFTKHSSERKNDEPKSLNTSQNVKKRKIRSKKTTSESKSTLTNGVVNTGTETKKRKIKTDGDKLKPKVSKITNNGKAQEKSKKAGKEKEIVEPVSSTINEIKTPIRQSTPVSNIQSTPVSSKTPKIIKNEPVSPTISTSSFDEGLKIFKWILSPLRVNQFINEFWEKAPCLIQRDNVNFFANLLSFQKIDEMLIENHVEFTKNIDITSYENGERKTLNPDGRAVPAVVWNFYREGCSIRLLNPQTFIESVFLMNTTLQEYFHCMVGSNVYLTPPNSQGFAPHYDDIEAFVLQIEGQKRWKLYNPRSEEEQLLRVSSGNFNQNEIGEPIMDVVLKPGDVLYFPRGIIHQACTEIGHHSLHITLSVYQKNSFGDLFEILIPKMLSRAISKNVELRKGVPINMWRNLGVVNSDNATKERTEIVRHLQSLLQNVFEEIPLDEAVDDMAIRFQHAALPPAITPIEKQYTVFGQQFNVNSDNSKIKSNFKIEYTTNVRLLRANILRLVQDGEEIKLYYYLDNSREYHEYESNYIEIDSETASIVDALIKCYPKYGSVMEFTCNGEIPTDIIQLLWDRGLIMIDKPL